MAVITSSLTAVGATRRGCAAAAAALAVCIVMGAGATASAAARCGTHKWCSTSLPPDQRATLLEQAMSQSDKIAMLTGGSASDVGVPAMSAADGAVGVRGSAATAFPAAIALAANFDRGRARQYGAAVGIEQRDHGNYLDFGPTMNIMRTPLGGRTFEAYGEDPFLSSQMAIGWVDGIQSEGVMGEPKHFIENDQEGQGGASPLFGVQGPRPFLNVTVDQRTLHEVDLRPFAASVQQAHAAAVMCSYNEVNGQFSCDNPDLLMGILRRQLGFRGAILSDALAAHTPQADLNAGMDWDIVGNSDNAAEVNLAIADGQVSEQTLDARVHEYLRTLFAYGFFDRPAYVNDPSKVNQAHSSAVDVAAEEGGATLLKNRGVLPLSRRHQKIAVIGKPANQYVFGYGSSQVVPNHTVTLVQGIRARAQRAGDTVTYDDGSNLAQAQADASRADVALVVAGDSESEGDDKQCMSLTPQCAPTEVSTISNQNAQGEQAAWGDQDSLIAGIAAANSRTVVVLETGAPVLTPWRARVASLLEAWYPGEDGGASVAHVLWGDVDPGGRLPATFPASYGQEPTAGKPQCYPGVPDLRVQTSGAAYYRENVCEGVFVGYRWFDVHHLNPVYPFGFGLSYTRFKLSHLKIRSNRRRPGGAVTVTVANTGTRTGDAVAELYLGLPSSTHVPEPPAELAGFRKLSLKRGHSRRVTIPIDARDLGYWNTASSSWRIARGCVRVMVGTSSRNLPLRGLLADGGAKCTHARRHRRPRRHHALKPHRHQLDFTG